MQQKSTPMKGRVAVVIRASKGLAQVAVSRQHARRSIVPQCLFFSTNIGESLQSRGFLASQGGTHTRFRIADVPPHPVFPWTTWVGRMITLHLNVAGYSGPLLFLFERPGIHNIRKIHSLHSSFLISQTTIVVFKINSSFIFFQNYYLTILKLLE